MLAVLGPFYDLIACVDQTSLSNWRTQRTKSTVSGENILCRVYSAVYMIVLEVQNKYSSSLNPCCMIIAVEHEAFEL